MNPLLDNDFLILLSRDRQRTMYARVISLNQYEHPIELLEGVVTAGSITIDGLSAVRRICSLTLSAKNLNINNVYWGLTTKVKIELGIENRIDKRYEDIIWFKLGLFILTDFKTTQVLNNYTINLSGKDKMCLLNGDVSGNFPAPVVFDSYADAHELSITFTSNLPARNKETIDGQTKYKYNYFDDTEPAYINIRDGLMERYQTDFEYIRGSGKIIGLNFRGSLSDIKISFSSNPVEIESSQAEELYANNSLLKLSKNYWIDLNKLATLIEGNQYVINLGDSDYYGFLVKNCHENDRFEWIIELKIPITLIIQEMLHLFGLERYSNIVIKDIEPYALEMLDNKNRGTSSLPANFYLLHDGTLYSDFITESELLANYSLYMAVNSNKESNIILDELIFRNYVEEDDTQLVDILNGSTLVSEVKTPTKIIKTGDITKVYTIQPVLEDEVAGYGMTLLVYPDELKGEVGDSITSILDKIVNMLGNYEYFYNLDGLFVFLAKPAYIKTPWHGTVYLNEEAYVDPSELYNKVAYTFDDAVLTTQYQNTPNMNNIKNDYIIWGERKNLSGNTTLFHGRYAIDNIPLEYTDFNGYTWTSNKKKSLLQAIQLKIEASGGSFLRKYDYPEGLDDKWWEVNDWANYFSTVFGINLGINHNMLLVYSLTKCDYYDIAQAFGVLSAGHSNTDVVTVIYTNPSKTQVAKIVAHGQCVHRYSQFMDLRTLNSGWNYGTEITPDGMASIINTWDPNKRYTLEDGSVVTKAYHPDYVDAFIYNPILPNDTTQELTDSLMTLIYPDAKNENGLKRQYALPGDVDWRELIHIMADDWYAHNHEDDYEINLRKNNSWPDLSIDLYPYSHTYYEQYYLDFTTEGGCWQDIYDIQSILYEYYNSKPALIADENSLNYSRFKTARDLVANPNDTTYLDRYISSGAYKYWHKDVLENPENLTFWFDFFLADLMGIGKFAVSVIGDRPKTIRDSAIKVIIYRDTPDVIYCTQTEYDYYRNRGVLKDGYVYIIIDDAIKYNFARSIRYKSVHQLADEMLYQYSYYNDTVNINNVPIYYLQPNTIISIKDELSKIIGYYIMNKIDISLSYNGMMSISAIKAPESIY